MSGVRDWLDQQAIEQLEERIDEDDLERMVEQGVQERIVPALQEIRERREAEPSAEEIRADYESLDPERAQEVFDGAVMDVIEAVFVLRESPRDGLQMLRQLVRDPWTVEALLLIFDHDEHIDPDYSAELKDSASEILTWVGVALMPEAYRPETVQAVGDRLGLDVERHG